MEFARRHHPAAEAAVVRDAVRHLAFPAERPVDGTLAVNRLLPRPGAAALASRLESAAVRLVPRSAVVASVAALQAALLRAALADEPPVLPVPEQRTAVPPASRPEARRSDAPLPV